MAYRALTDLTIDLPPLPDTTGVHRRFIRRGDMIPDELADPAMLSDGRADEVGADHWTPPEPFPGASDTRLDRIAARVENKVSKLPADERWAAYQLALAFIGEVLDTDTTNWDDPTDPLSILYAEVKALRDAETPGGEFVWPPRP